MFFRYSPLAIALVASIVAGALTPIALPSPPSPEAGGRSSVEGKSHPIFAPILARLTAGTKIPIRLPRDIPSAGEGPLYVSLQTVSADRYSIELALAPDCYGAGACRWGELSGERKTPRSAALRGRKVTLTRGIAGYFTPSVCGANCSDATLIWEQEGARYSIALKAGKLEFLKRMANSAIVSAPVTADRGSIPVDRMISTNGIGPARSGMKYGQLKTLLKTVSGRTAEFSRPKNFRVDFDAIAVRQSGQVQ